MTGFQDQVLKFANYFLSRKHVQSTKNAAAVLSVIKTFTTNKVGSDLAPCFFLVAAPI